MKCLKIAILALYLHTSLSYAMDMCPVPGNPSATVQQTLFAAYVTMTAGTLAVGYEKKLLKNPDFIVLSSIMVTGCILTGVNAMSSFFSPAQE